MIAPLTKREIRNIGYNRYTREKHRLYWTVLLVIIGAVACFSLSEIGIYTHNKILWNVVGLVVFLIFYIPFTKVAGFDAVKAGKRFLAEWEKENGVVRF